MPRRTRDRAADQPDFVRRLEHCVKVIGTQNGLAAAAEIPQSTLRGYLLRRVEPQRDALIRIADAAQVSVQWLATGKGQRDANARSEDSPYGVHDDLRGFDPIISAAANTLNVPLEFARLRLVGSPELQAFVRALNDWAPFVSIPLVGEPRCACVLQRAELEAILPVGCDPSRISAAKIVGADLAPRFRDGDLGLIDTAATIHDGPYCMINRGGTPEFVIIKIRPEESREVTIEPAGGNVDFRRTVYEIDVASLKRIHRVAGRLVAGIRFVSADPAPKG